MSKTNNTLPRITGLLVLEVRKSNPNGDPERESSPRQRPDGKGEISPVSVKRKLRDLVLEKEGIVWREIKSQLGITADEGFQILENRGRDRVSIEREIMNDQFIGKYWDARLFGNTFLEDADKLKARHKGASDDQLAKVKDNLRAGVAHFGVGVSVAPIEIEFSTWTSKSGVETGKDRGMAPMAFRVVKHGIYTVPFFVNPNLAHKTGCTELDVKLMLSLLSQTYKANPAVIRTMVEVVHAHVFTHKSPLGSVSDFALIDALTPKKLGDTCKPSESVADYKIPTWEEIKGQEVRKGATKK